MEMLKFTDSVVHIHNREERFSDTWTRHDSYSFRVSGWKKWRNVKRNL